MSYIHTLLSLVLLNLLFTINTVFGADLWCMKASRTMNANGRNGSAADDQPRSYSKLYRLAALGQQETYSTNKNGSRRSRTIAGSFLVQLCLFCIFPLSIRMLITT